MNRRILHSFFVTISALFGLRQDAHAQGAATYEFTALTGTYAEITGGTQLTAVQSDDGTSAAFPIGFTFNFAGTDYTEIKANANCWITFGTTTSTTWSNSAANLNTIKPALMAFWDDLAGWVTGTNASNFTYLTTGTAPNRILTVQYKNWQSPRSAASDPPTFHLQVKLYESTNVVEYIYQQIATAAASSASATIGIGDGQTTPGYLSLNNASAAPAASSTTFTTNIGGVPASGQIYRFKPLPPIDIKMDSIVTNAQFCANGSTPVSVAITNKGTATITDILVNWSVDGIDQAAVSYTMPTPVTNLFTAPGNTAVVPLGNVFFPNATARVIKAWVVQANGLPDAVNTNDTATGSKTPNLTGVYVNITPRDTTICEGTQIALDAGTHPKNPIYIWNDATLTQTKTVSTAGVYSIKVQNTDGCYDYDTVTVFVYPNPLAYSIAIIDNSGGNYTFNVIGAQNITSYTWNFGDGQNQSGTGMPGQVIHQYDTSGDYTVTLTLRNNCGEITVVRMIRNKGMLTGIKETDAIRNSFSIYPNPSNAIVTISNTAGLKITSLTVFNLTGQEVYREDDIKAIKTQFNTAGLAAGIYNIVIDSEKGKIVKKLEVTR